MWHQIGMLMMDLKLTLQSVMTPNLNQGIKPKLHFLEV